MNNMNFRRPVVDHLIPYCEENDKIIILVCDMGFGVIDNFKEAFPDRIYNVGIMEQGTVGIAAGMALSGLVPVVYSIVNFLVFRALEQIRNDVILQDLNVKFISTGVNNYFERLGKSHSCGNDDIALMNLINMPIYDPYTGNPEDYENIIKEWILSPKAGYLRV